MAKNNIAFIANGFGLSPVMSGGEIRLFSLLKRFRGRVPFSLYTSTGGAAAASNFFGSRPGFTVTTVRTSLFMKTELFSFQRLSNYFLSGADTAEKLLASGPAAVYTSSDFYCDVYPAYRLKQKAGTKWFAMLHHKYENPFKRAGNFLTNSIMYYMQQKSFKMIARCADIVFVLETDEGARVAADLRSLGYRGKTVRVKNGIEIGSRKKQSKIENRKSKINKDVNLATYVGGLRPAKGMNEIVPIWKTVCGTNPRLKLNVIGSGSGSHMKKLKAGIIAAGLENNVKLLGFVSPSELGRHLLRSSVFFLPSLEEGWGISVLEALKYGNKPVVYDLPAFKVFGNKVARVPLHDRAGYASALVKAFKSKKSGYPGMAFLKKFSWDDIALKELSIIKSNLD